MNEAPIFFEFDQQRSAYLALDTLTELGYRPEFVDGAARPTLHIHVDKQDVASALEIAQAHGGRLAEQASSGLTETDAFAMAYDLDEGIRIPAHVVNEDFTDSYASPAAPEAAAYDRDPPAGYDLSEETYDGFSAGIRL